MRELCMRSVDAAKAIKNGDLKKGKSGKLFRSKSEKRPPTGRSNRGASSPSPTFNNSNNSNSNSSSHLQTEQVLIRTSSAGRAGATKPPASAGSGLPQTKPRGMSESAVSYDGPLPSAISSGSAGSGSGSGSGSGAVVPADEVASISAVLAEVEQWQFEDADGDDVDAELASADAAARAAESSSVHVESECIRKLDQAEAPVGQESIVVADPLQFNKPRLFRLPLAPKSTMAKALWAETPKADRFKLVSLFLTGQVREGKRKMLGVMNTLGLSGLNQIILSRSGNQLCRALKIIADRRNHPVMIHCSHGKDRTGLLVSLVLACVGTAHEAIRDDYCQSAKHGQSEAGKQRMKQINPDLDIEHFTSAPPEVVDKTFAFIKKKWGTLENYLDSIGFTAEWRRAMKSALCVRPTE
jgi:hypothetical protein